MKRKRRSPIHDRIARLREAKKLRQEDVADAVGVHLSAVSHWETGDGRPDVSRLPKLAEILDTSVDELIDGDVKYQKIRAAFGAAEVKA